MKKNRGKHTRARLGQHFLTDARVRDRIIASLDPKPGDRIVEIGAGRGFLTEALAPRVKKLWAIELDSRWALRLKSAFIHSPPVEVLEADVLRVDFHRFLAECREGEKLRVVGNLPYYISSPILFRLFEFADLLQDATLMLQKETAERITASPVTKDYGYASLATQLFTDAALLFTIPPSAFSPPPQVESAVVHLHMAPRNKELAIEDAAPFLKFAQQIFLEKRKTLFNNLKRFIPRNASDTHARLQALLTECALDSTVRAENLSLHTTAQLYRTLRQRGFL